MIREFSIPSKPAYDTDASVRRNTADSLLGDGTIRSIERWNTARREEVDAHDEALAA